MAKKHAARFEIRLPEKVDRGLEVAADQQMTSKSEIVRQAVIARLKDDGLLSESDASAVYA